MASDLDSLDWSVNEFFYGTPHQPSQYGFLREGSFNDRPNDSSKKGGGTDATPKKPAVLQRSISGISDHLEKTVEIEVPLCCESCGTKILDVMTEMEGVTGVKLDYSAGKVILRGEVSPKEALKLIRKIKPKATHRVHAKNLVYSKKPESKAK